jgi:hypothetical protein
MASPLPLIAGLPEAWLARIHINGTRPGAIRAADIGSRRVKALFVGATGVGRDAGSRVNQPSRAGRERLVSSSMTSPGLRWHGLRKNAQVFDLACFFPLP